MWVEKLPSGHYRYCERFVDPVTGETKRVSVTLDKHNKQTEKIAYELLRTKMYESDPNKTTFRELCELYLADQKPYLKPSTWERNRICLGTLQSILGANTRVEKMTAGWVRQKLQLSGRSPGTINEMLTRFKAAIRWAYRNDVIEDIRFIDKLDSVRDISQSEKVKDKYLETEELDAVLEAMNDPLWTDLTLFLALSGLRVGEALALLRTDLDLEKREINVDKTYDSTHDIVTTPKTYASTRTVYMQDELYELCRRLLLDDNIVAISDILFNKYGKRASYNAYRAYLRKYSDKAIGRPITPHVLRHTHASILMEQGMELDAIAARLGHDDSNVTKQIYTHVTKKLETKWNKQVKEIRFLN